MSGAIAKCILLATALSITACASTIKRAPFTGAEQAAAVDVDIMGARRWADAPVEAFPPSAKATTTPNSPVTVLALSGGGGDGAFGAAC